MHTGPLCSAGSGCHPVPRLSPLLLGPPTPRLPSAHGSGRPLPRAYLGAGASSWPTAPAPADALPSESGHRLSASPVDCRGATWVSQVSGSSSSYAPQSNTPPGAVSPCPRPGRSRSPSGRMKPWAPRIDNFRGYKFCGSHVRAPTHRPRRHRRERKAHYRPGGLPDRTGFAPAGRRTKFHEVIASLHFLSDQPCLVAPCVLCATQSVNSIPEGNLRRLCVL